ncbi:penicillin-binding protein [bacterium]|nr:penicillin-binding protein [bacterium]
MQISSFRSSRIPAGLIRTRFQFALLLCFAWIGIIILRLLFLQVIKHEHYIARANKQRQSVVTLYPERGPILDRKNRQLAISIEEASVYGITEEMKNPQEVIEAIGKITNVNAKDVLAHTENKSFFWIARKIPQEKAEAIKRLELSGVYFTNESRRYYPNKTLASHLLGFVGMDNKGLSGVEYQYEHVITGVPGKLFALRDAKRRLLMTGNSILSPSSGRTLQLSIDASIQHIAETELAAGVEERGASGGAVIIMKPDTGEILALANVPDFNPNIYGQTQAGQWKNRAITDYYEPGSTFKPVVATAALDEDLVKPDDQFDCQWGSIVLAGIVMKDHKPFGILSFRQIIEKSSNVGTIKIGLKVGPEGLVRYARMFGFGQKTGIDLPGESPGILRSPKKWSALSIGAISIGQEIGVTPLQVLRMITAIGNDGYLVSPHTVLGLSDSSGDLKPAVFPQPQQLPIKHTTLVTIQEFLEGVVDHGSGTLAQIPGYTVAGKTGTAQKIGPSGTYADGGYIASFAGYAPAHHPAISMIVVLDKPKKEFYGGRVAAPLFRKIGQQVLKYLDIPPDQITENPAITAKAAFPRGIEANYPEGMEPVAFTPPPVQHHKLVIAHDDGKANELVMPYLFGKTASETIEILSKTKVQFRLLGTGTVIKQWPTPGSTLKQDDMMIITLANSQNSIIADRNVSSK